MSRTIIGLLFVLIFFRPAHAELTSGCPAGDSIEGRYLIRFGNEMTTTQQQKAVAFLTDRMRWIHKNTHVSSKPQVDSAVAAADLAIANLSKEEAQALSKSPGVLTVEPDCWVHIRAVPNDPLVPSQWAHQIVNLSNAWDVSRFASDVIVAVSDSGVDYKHIDLAQNIWRNEAEINGRPYIDDDGNGCIDDFHGCDLADDDGDPSPGSLESAKHGTHVAGIIGAVGNNRVGIAGAAWKIRILASKGFSNFSDSASTSDLIESIYYAVNNGAKIINCSWGIDRAPTQAEADAFRFALSKGVLPVVAAGNESKDAQLTSPASIPGVLAVGSVNSKSVLSGFSNFGSVVGIFAPGGDARSLGSADDEFVYSTLPGDSYGNLRGTSMAAPLVSGIAALILSVNPAVSPEAIISVIEDSAQTKSSWTLDGHLVQTPIIDAEKALKRALSINGTQVPKPCVESANCQSGDDPVWPGANPIAERSNGGGCALFRSSESSMASYGLEWAAQGWTGFIVSCVLTLPVFLVGKLRD